MKTSCLSLITGGCSLIAGCQTSETYRYTVISAPNGVAADRARVRAVLGSVATQTKMRELGPNEAKQIQVNYQYKPAPTRIVAYTRPSTDHPHIELSAHANGDYTLIDLGRAPRNAELPDFEITHRLLTPALTKAFGSRVVEGHAENFCVTLPH